MSCVPSLTPLSEAKAGPILSVERLEGSEAICRRLREVGFCEKAEIRLLSRGGQMICNVCGTRLALSRKLAKQIWVSSVLSKEQESSCQLGGAIENG